MSKERTRTVPGKVASELEGKRAYKYVNASFGVVIIIKYFGAFFDPQA